MLQEPCLVAAAFLALFLAVMVWVRLDLTLCPDKAAEDKLVVAALCSSIARHQHVRADREVSDALQAQVANMSKLLKGQMARAAYAEADVALTRQRCDAMARCRSVVALL